MPEDAKMLTDVPSLRAEAHALRERLVVLAEAMDYEDLDHALLGVDIVEHVLKEVAEHGGLGGEIARTPDPALHERAISVASHLREVRLAADDFFAEHPDEDLSTAITALEIARGSLDEVVERYEAVT